MLNDGIEEANTDILKLWRQFHLESQNPPETLYHYTRPEGLQGILENSTLWATHAFHLNDKRDFRYGQDLFFEALDDAESSALIGASKSLECLRSEFQNLLRLEEEHPSAFCISLSAAKDDCDQYREYSDGGAGYCISLSSKRLINALSRYQHDLGYANRPMFALIRVEYDSTRQRTIMKEVIENASSSISKLGAQFQSCERIVLRRISSACFETVMRLSSYFKHPKWRPEDEWRIVPGPWWDPDTASKSLDDLKRQRGTANAPIHYLEISLMNNGGVFDSLSEIWIGPKLDFKTASDALSKSVALREIRNAGVDVRERVSATSSR